MSGSSLKVATEVTFRTFDSDSEWGFIATMPEAGRPRFFLQQQKQTVIIIVIKINPIEVINRMFA